MANLYQSKRVVVKVGTSTLTYKNGLLNIRKIENLVKVLSDLKNAGKQIVLVSSGAIGVGAGELNLKEKPKDMPTKQACAAVGQCELMNIYGKLFAEYNHRVAQVLLTRDAVENDDRKEYIINTFNRLLDLNVIPIVNENDTVSVEEIVFGDNDSLSAIVGEIIGTELLIILSDIDGLYDDDPRKNKNAKLIKRVESITPDIIDLAGEKGSEFGTGGMITKIHAAQIAMNAGFPMIIINGDNAQNLYDLYDSKEIGTIFQAKGE